MTEKDKEIQELRRRVKFLEKKNAELEQMHRLDMSGITFQRRQIDFLMESKEANDRN